MKISRRLLIAAGFFAAISETAVAGGLRVTPMRLDFSPQQPAGQFEIANLGQGPLGVQIKAFRWTQKDGQDEVQAAHMPLTHGDTVTVRVTGLGELTTTFISMEES